MKHPWKARFGIFLMMTLLAFIGLVFTYFYREHAWQYWRLMAAVFALLCLGLSFYVRRQNERDGISIWHEILHWAGLAGSICIVSFLVKLGIVGNFEAALIVLTLLSLATFLAGVYTEISFVVIGALLGAFVIGLAYLFKK